MTVADSAGHPSGGVLGECRRAVGTPGRRWLLIATGLLALLAAAAVTTGTPTADRSFAGVAGPVLSLTSVTLPFLGAALTRELRGRPRAALSLTLLAAVAVAVAVGLFGVLVCLVATALAPTDPEQRPWQHVAVIALGGVLVQVVAQLVGTGLGLLLRPPAVAGLATIVLPLGLWLALGAAGATSAQAWLTPFSAAQRLLAGPMSALGWVQLAAMATLWCAALNVAGARRLRRDRGQRAQRAAHDQQHP